MDWERSHISFRPSLPHPRKASSVPLVTSARGVLRHAVTALAGLALATGGLTAAALPAHSAAAATVVAADVQVRVNQLGYLPDGPKRATVVSSATGPLPWQLRDSSGTVAASGTTTVH